MATTRKRAARRVTSASPSPAAKERRPAQRARKTRAGKGGARARRQVAQRRRILVLGMLTIVALGYLLWFTPFLAVSSVQITGNRTVPAEQVRSAAAIPAEHPMLRVDTDGVAARVAGLAGVAEADVSRSWPSTIKITVGERRAVAYHAGAEGVRLVDAHGVSFRRAGGAEQPGGLPRLELPAPQRTDERTRAATAVLAALPGELLEQVGAVRAATPGNVELELRSGRLVRWGDAEQNAYKARVLAVLLTREGGTLDVSSPELPTVS